MGQQGRCSRTAATGAPSTPPPLLPPPCAPPRPHLRVRRMASCRFCSEVLWYSMGAHCSRRGARERRLLSTHGAAACACCGRFPPRRAALRPAWCCCGRPAAGAGTLLLCWDREQSRAAPQLPHGVPGLPPSDSLAGCHCRPPCTLQYGRQAPASANCQAACSTGAIGPPDAAAAR